MKGSPARWSLLFVLLLVGQPAQARPPLRSTLAPEKTAALDAALAAAVAQEAVVGLAVGVIQEGRIAYLNGFGYEDRERGVPVSGQTLFRWASCSKPLTAVAALQLLEKQALDLDRDVRRYVPEFPDKGALITARQLLGHTSGIVHYTNGKVIPTRAQYRVPNPFADVVLALDTFKESPLLFAPGARYSYSTYAYILLSAVVQRAGKQPFGDQVQARIAAPLGMSTLQPDYQWKRIDHRAVGYVKRWWGITRSTDTDVSWKLGGGGYLSNIEDMARFAEGLINRRLVSEPTESLMWRAQQASDGRPTGYGLGFNVEQDGRGRLRVGHEGAQEKTRTSIVIFPREKHGVVVMTNSEWVDPERVIDVVYRTLQPR